MKRTVKAWCPVRPDGTLETAGYQGGAYHGIRLCFKTRADARMCGWGDASPVTITYDDTKPRPRPRARATRGQPNQAGPR